MLKYVLKRLAASVVTLAIVITLVFILLRQMPIEGYFDNFEKLNEAQINAKLANMGLTQPIFVQLRNFFGKLLHGDLGLSARYSVGTPISQIIAQKAPLSIWMGLMSMAISLLTGIPLGAAMARSAGTSVQLMGKDNGYAILRMPSSELRRVLLTCRATIGVVGNAEHSNIVIGKAGRNRWKGVRPTVRGTVMNPVDHPHGGGEGKNHTSGRPSVTPWGKPTKGYKTRDPKKGSNRLIIRRRKTK